MMTAESMHPMHRLSTLLEGVCPVDASLDTDVAGLALDSRDVGPGWVFIARRGEQADGRDFIDAAIAAGACAIVVQAASAKISSGSVPMFPVADVDKTLGLMADRFFGKPSAELYVCGVTGTNGKTSVCHYLAHILNHSASVNTRAGVIGTLGHGLGNDLAAIRNTTPDAITLHSALANMRGLGAGHVVMEVSSHGLSQQRTAGIRFNCAVFTNLGRDHLDYHGDMEAYGSAKLSLFATTDLSTAVVNTDDLFSARVIERARPGVTIIAYGLDAGRQPKNVEQQVRGSSLRISKDGIHLEVRYGEQQASLSSQLLGGFNASNLLAAIAAAVAAGMDFPEAVALAGTATGVAGRMERFGGGEQPLVVVDYSHTPEGLEQALSTLRDVGAQRLCCVFGCGGDRDAGKRPLMGEIAVRLADSVILTDDNPRNEDPLAIIADIQSGIADATAVEIIHDREAAIARALQQAKAGDVLLVAGKGHEATQTVQGQVIELSDREIVSRLLGDGGT